jgi:hypothetical protein
MDERLLKCLTRLHGTRAFDRLLRHVYGLSFARADGHLRGGVPGLRRAPAVGPDLRLRPQPRLRPDALEKHLGGAGEGGIRPLRPA